MEKFRQGLRDESWQQYTKERGFDRFSAKSSSDHSAPITSSLEKNISFDNFNERFDERFPIKFDEMLNQKTFKIQINGSLNSLDT